MNAAVERCVFGAWALTRRRTSRKRASSRSGPNDFGSGVRQLLSRQSSFSHSRVALALPAREYERAARYAAPSSVVLKENARWNPSVLSSQNLRRKPWYPAA